MMLLQRAIQPLRQSAIYQPSTLTPFILSRLAPPRSMLVCQHRIQSRPATTQPISQSTIKSSTGTSILEKQRLNRPTSPHLGIYQPQITWYLSSLNRITGSIFSGTFYLFGAAYLVSPLFGWHLESSALVAAFGSLPWVAKAGLKFTVALPFAFKCWNGVRHLVWDLGKELTNSQVVRTGWGVIGLSVLSSVALVALI